MQMAWSGYRVKEACYYPMDQRRLSFLIYIVWELYVIIQSDVDKDRTSWTWFWSRLHYI